MKTIVFNIICRIFLSKKSYQNKYYAIVKEKNS